MSGCSRIGVHGDLVAVDDVEDAVGHAGIPEELGEHERCARILLRGLQHERVPARDRVREHPQRHHRREVERGDARHDAERLADRVHVDAGGGLLGESALQQAGDPAGELHVLEAALHLAHRVGEHLAVLRRDRGRDLGLPVVQQLADLEHRLGALGERRRSPRWECLGRRRDGLADLLGARECDLVGLLARRRVEDGAGPSGLTRNDLPADPVADRSIVSSSLCTRSSSLLSPTPAPAARRP